MLTVEFVDFLCSKLQLTVLMQQHTFLAYVVIIQSRCYRFYPVF